MAGIIVGLSFMFTRSAQPAGMILLSSAVLIDSTINSTLHRPDGVKAQARFLIERKSYCVESLAKILYIN
jgi:hypothetical protein